MTFSQISDFNKFIKKLSATEKGSAFLVIIENFHMLNSAYGHSNTDKLIAKLCSKFKKFGHVYRIQNDQISIISPESTKPALKNLTISIGEIIREFGANGNSSKGHAHISAVMNSALVSKSSSTEKLFKKLYLETLKKSNFSLELAETESKESEQKSKLQMQLANQISKAVNEKRLKLALQPIIEAKTGKIIHHECLLRIEENGVLKSAGSYIPIAEKMGLIYKIDIHVLDMVIDLLEKDKNLSLSFNISNMTIGNKQWLKRFFDRISPNIASRLIVEITETAATRDLKETGLFIGTLQEAGCQIALDDFGSGYTSFRQIRALELDYVKIDGSLITDIANNHHNKLLVKSLMDFLKGLGLKTIAEHVDSGETAKLLMKFGIDFMQGNYFGKAI